MSRRGNCYANAHAESFWSRLKTGLVAGRPIGCLFGMYGTSAGQPTANSAAFKWLKYEVHDPMFKK
jgi:xylan 1,4-beta-xylosidase